MSSQNALERLLRLAAELPAYRPDFYRSLLAATVYVLGHSSRPEVEGVQAVPAEEALSLQTWTKADGSAVIAFFSSLEELQRSVEQDSRYLALNARALFVMTRGATLMLNPRSDHAKEFLPDEIEALLSGGVNRLPELKVAQQARQVVLGPPKSYPADMVASVMTLLATRSNARTAYLAEMHDPASDDEPHLVIGIEAENDADQLFRDVGVVAGDSAPVGQPVDLVRVVRGQQGLSEYFVNHVEPFFKRA